MKIVDSKNKLTEDNSHAQETYQASKKIFP